MRIEGNVLVGPSIDMTFADCPKRGGLLRDPDTIIIHYTGGDSARGSAEWLCASSVQASAHIIIDRVTATTYQLVPFNVVAWHAGESSFTFPDGTERSGFNQFSIGIELDNAGPLTKTNAGYQAWFGHLYPESETFCGTHKHQTEARYWHAFSEVQLRRLLEICRLLVDAYPIKHILGHDDIAPTRKTDPGPAFPMERLQQRLIHPHRNQDGPDPTKATVGRVTASELNIRSGPSADNEAVAHPLTRNQVVRVIEKKGEWYHVRTAIEGWVHANYIEITHGDVE